MRVLLAGGGSGGHIYPLLAIAEAAPAWQFHYVGTPTGLESRIVPRTAIPFHAIAAGGVRGKSPLVRARSSLRTARGTLGALRLIGRLRPDVVVSSGGYAAFPVALAARWRGVPLVLIEPNATPGLSNRLLMGRATRILSGYDAAARALPPGVRARCAVTGVPVRPALVQRSRTEAREALGIPQNAVLLVAMGGSQGARPISQAVLGLAPSLQGAERILLATGERDFEAFKGEGSQHVQIEPYFWDVAGAYAAADLVVARAGAMTCAELTAFGIASVLVPSPYVPGDQQTENARLLAGEGAAVLLPQADLSPQSLLAAVAPLLRDTQRRQAMADAARALGRPDAAAAAVREIRRVHAGRSGAR